MWRIPPSLRNFSSYNKYPSVTYYYENLTRFIKDLIDFGPQSGIGRLNPPVLMIYPCRSGLPVGPTGPENVLDLITDYLVLQGPLLSLHVHLDTSVLNRMYWPFLVFDYFSPDFDQ